MATTTKNWGTGTGAVTIDYNGSGNGTITITSDDNNLYEARSMQIVVQTTAGSHQQTKTVNISQAARIRTDISNAVVTAANQTYSGSALTPAPTVKLNGVTIPSTGYDVTYSNNTNAGTATVTVTGKGDYTGTTTGTFTIAQATGQVTTAPTARSVTYSGSAQYLVVAGSGTGTMQYRYKLDSASSWSSWSTTRARATNAGTYNVQYRAAASSDGNYTVSAVGELNVTMAKRTPVVNVAPTKVTGLVYTGSAQNLLTGGSMKHSSSSSTAVAGTFTYKQGTNAGTYSSLTWSFTPTDSTNYNNASGTVSGSVSIAKADPIYTAPIAQSLTYSGSSQYLTTAGSTSHGTIQYSSDNSNWYTTRRTGTNAGSYTTYWKLVGDANHNDVASISISVTIAKADRTVSFTKAPVGIDVGGTSVLAASASAGGGTISFASGDTSKATVSGNLVTGVAAGSVTITASITADTNYNAASVSYNATVAVLDYVDMGLPSGRLWAKKNIDVTQSSGFTASIYQYECSFFSWGNVVGHNLISDTAFDYNFNAISYSSTPGAGLTSDIPVNTTYDAARAILGSAWQMPTQTDMIELFNSEYTKFIDANGDDIPTSTANKLVDINGVRGVQLKSKVTGNIIFIPNCGWGNGTTWQNRAGNGFYWESTKYSNTTHSDTLFINNSRIDPREWYTRQLGMPIRAVRS